MAYSALKTLPEGSRFIIKKGDGALGLSFEPVRWLFKYGLKGWMVFNSHDLSTCVLTL